MPGRFDLLVLDVERLDGSLLALAGVVKRRFAVRVILKLGPGGRVGEDDVLEEACGEEAASTHARRHDHHRALWSSSKRSAPGSEA